MERSLSIITLHYINNYGSVLQSYATQNYLESKGFNPSIIDISRDNYSYESLLNSAKEAYMSRLGVLSKTFIMNILLSSWKKDFNRNNIIFSNFRKKNLKLTNKYNSSKELFDNPPVSDYYCSGSDQIWNTNYNGAILDEYFLKFAPNSAVKFAFSSGFGKQEFNNDELKVIKDNLEKFDFISVREDSAKKIINELGIDALHVLDPTLLLDKNMWDSKFDLHNIINKKYLLVYQLNKNNDMIRFAKKKSKKEKLKLIIISDDLMLNIFNKKNIVKPNVLDFLRLINNCEYIVTDSFHGLAFSINFNKQFYVFYPPKYSTRLNSLLTLTNTTGRIYNDELIFDDIDYNFINNVLKKKRKEMSDYIDKVKEFRG